MGKKTPLYEEHLKLKARMTDFAGFELPISYTSMKEEHNAVRNSAGIFDVSHMGEIDIRGSDALSFVQYIFTNDASRVENGKAFYSLMCRDDGGILDDVIIMRYSQDHFFVVVNASNIEKDFEWLKKHSHDFSDLEIENLSDKLSMIAVQGPEAPAIVQSTLSLSSLPEHFRFTGERYKGSEMILSRTGYTGEDGFEIIMINDLAAGIWKSILETGGESITPCGLGARDTLRIEASYMLYGNDIDEDHTPIEAGLSWAVKKKNGIHYIGSKVLEEQKEKGTKVRLVGFEAVSRGIPRHGDPVIANGEDIGRVTSATYGPFLKKTIGMAYIDTGYTGIGKIIGIKQKGRQLDCKIAPLPFYKKNK